MTTAHQPPNSADSDQHHGSDQKRDHTTVLLRHPSNEWIAYQTKDGKTEVLRSGERSENPLWQKLTEAAARREARRRERSEILAKLTPRERKVLGL